MGGPGCRLQHQGFERRDVQLLEDDLAGTCGAIRASTSRVSRAPYFALLRPTSPYFAANEAQPRRAGHATALTVQVSFSPGPTTVWQPEPRRREPPVDLDCVIEQLRCAGLEEGLR